jgi:simple sugar transport system substrate-binding protein/ribose transport system substrate-binding protein
MSQSAWYARRVLPVVAALAMTACSLEPKPGAAPPPTEKADKRPAAAPAKPRKLAGVVFQEDMFFQLVLLGMKQAAQAGGVEIKTASCSNKPDKEGELITTYLADKVDAIVISAVSPKGSVAALQQAHDRGVPIITCNTKLDADFPRTFIECSPEDLGAKTGKAARAYIESKLGGKAKVAIIQFKSQLAEQSLARVGGFKKALEGLPGVAYVADQDAHLTEKATEKVRDILTQHKDLDLVYAANEGGTVGATLAVKNANLGAQTKVFGTDVSDQLLEFLKSPDDILQAICCQQPVEIGRRAVQAALGVLDGKPVEPKTMLEGILLSRSDAPGLAKFAEQYKEWVAGLSAPTPGQGK